MLFSVETKVTIGKKFLLGLKKGLRSHFKPEMELKVKNNLIIKVLTR